MAFLTLRKNKTSPLTHNEMDDNLLSLNSAKAEQSSVDMSLALKANDSYPSTSGTFTHSGDVVLSGFGNRITGDFSNATPANRVMFQTSTVNSGTIVGTVALGTIPDNYASGFIAYANSDPLASQSVSAYCFKNLETRFSSNSTTGTHLPMTFYTGGAERMRIGTDGNVGVGRSGGFTGAETVSVNGYLTVGNDTAPQVLVGNTGASTGVVGTYSNHALEFRTNNTGKLRIDTSGNVLVTSPSGLGYGAGSGGTVTQATSKSTAVTLNKPSGRITTAADALAGNTVVEFTFNNSLISNTDTLSLGWHENGMSGDSFQYWSMCTSGKACIYIRNISGGSLTQSLSLNFEIIKGAVA